MFVPARAEDLSLSFASGVDSAAQGAVLYRNGASRYAALAPGTNGQVLTSGGAAANPTWTTISGGVTDHGALTGLSDDDHSIYALLAPAGSARNVIQPTGTGIIPLTLQQSGAATDQLTLWKKSGGDRLLGILPGSTAGRGAIRMYATDTQSIDFVVDWDGVDIYVGLENQTIGSAPAIRAKKFSGPVISPTNAYIEMESRHIYHALGDGGSASFPAHLFKTENVVATAGGRLFEVRNQGSSRFWLGVEGLLGSLLEDAATNAASDAFTLQHNSSGTPAAGYGSRQRWLLESSTTVDRDAANVEISWATATDASRKARAVWNVYDTAVREGLRIEASGTAPMIGFLGAAAVARTAAYTASNVTTDRTFDANATTLDEVADVLGTLISDLQLFGLLG